MFGSGRVVDLAGRCHKRTETTGTAHANSWSANLDQATADPPKRDKAKRSRAAAAAFRSTPPMRAVASNPVRAAVSLRDRNRSPIGENVPRSAVVRCATVVAICVGFGF